MEIILFGSRLSPFVEKVARALDLKHLFWRLVEPRTPLDLRRWNPITGKMPVLAIDGEKVFDSTFILRRLDEVRPDPPLFSSDPHRAAAQRLLEDWCDESLYWHGMALRWSPRNAAATADQIAATVPPLARPLVRWLAPWQIGAMPRAQGFGRLSRETLVHELALRLDDLVSLLGERKFFHGEGPGAADLALYGMISMLCSGPTPEAEGLIRERPTLARHARRVEEQTTVGTGSDRTAA